MANSTRTLASVVAFAKSFPEIAPVIQTSAGGLSLQPALTIAEDVMTELVAENFNWKWNRFLMPLFHTNSYQQDYALNVVNLGWLEYGVLLDVNNTARPKPIWPLEIVKDLPPTSAQYGQPGQVCWLQNDQLYFGIWGAADTGNNTAGGNPQPNQVINNPVQVGSLTAPQNPITQVRDAFGNLWVVTGFGTTGATSPFLANLNPVFPTPTNPNQAATTKTDGTVTWTAVNPKGMGIRANPIPPLTGVVYQFNLVAQFRPFSFQNGGFTQFSQTIEPIPDDYAKYFRDGFVAHAYRHSPEKGVRAKFADMHRIWLDALNSAKRQGDRERDNAGFYPATSLMQQPFTIYPGPAYPFPLPWG